MEKVLVAKGLANKLFAAEVAVDEAMVKTSELIGGLVWAKGELNLSSIVADPAFARVSEAIASLSASRTALVAAHKQLDDSKLRLGIRAVMGPQRKPDIEQEIQNAPLREVG